VVELADVRAPKAILFDIGGTVLDERRYDLEAGVRSVVKRETDVAEICREFRAEVRDKHAVDREVDLSRWLTERVSLRDDITTLEDSLWDAIATLVPVPGVEAVLRRLKSDLVPFAAISNAPFCGRILEANLEKYGLRSYFQFVVSSADVGFRKPSAAIFETALSRLGVKAEQTWFIGDTLREDIAGAAKVGLQPIWISRNPDEPGMEYTGVRIRDWSEFMSVYEAAIAGKATG
jgi:HAD superfamily hydrolase (TIGR01509 family)